MVRPRTLLRAREISAENPFVWMLPMIIFLGAFYLYPLLDVIRLSFTDASLLRETFKYGLRSYRVILMDPWVSNSFRITLQFALFNVVFQLLLGLILAIAINSGLERRLHGTIFVRTSVLAAWVIPGVVVGILWRMILTSSNYGIVNYVTRSIWNVEIPFLYDPKYSLTSIIIANIWRGTAFSMILQFAGLQRIPEELYSAAKVDGASAWQQFRYVTLPQLKPILFINTVLISIHTFNAFDMILALTGGGPARTTEVLSINAYNQIFRFFHLGRGAALAVVLLLINLTMTAIYYWSIGREEGEAE